VLEVKNIEGFGATVDAVLVNGTLSTGDRIVVSTLEGPIVTTVKTLLTPPPNRDARVTGSGFLQHSSLKGATGLKIVAQDASDLAKAVAGTTLMVLHPTDDEDDVKADVQSDVNNLTKIQLDPVGVTVHASTLGALEALLQFLRKECKPPIPVSQATIGTVFKKHVNLCSTKNNSDQEELERSFVSTSRLRPMPKSLQTATRCASLLRILYTIFRESFRNTLTR